MESGAEEAWRIFPGGPYLLLHTLAHLLIQSVAMRCGYPAASIRERIYVDEAGERYGLLLFTASADAEGTLGGLVEQAPSGSKSTSKAAVETAALCAGDPVCAHHEPGVSMEERWLHGAACHGCALVAETSCEMHNDYLDRALVAPVIGQAGRGVLPPRKRTLTQALLDLPAHLRRRLAQALESGVLAAPFTPHALRRVLGLGEVAVGLIAALERWEALAVAGPAKAAWLRSLEEAEGRREGPEFVWSGPEVHGLHCPGDAPGARSVARRRAPVRSGFPPTPSLTALARSNR